MLATAETTASPKQAPLNPELVRRKLYQSAAEEEWKGNRMLKSTLS